MPEPSSFISRPASSTQQPFEVDQHGLTIRGMIYKPESAARHPTMLMLHGFTGQRMESGFMYVQLARALVERGMAAVTFDFLHSGESDGSFEQMLVTGELADALRVTRWIVGQPLVDRSRLGLLGFSLGGLLAACTVARMDVYRTLVLLAPTTEENLCRHAREHAMVEPVTIGPHRLHQSFFDDLRTLNSLDDCLKNPRPTLLVHGTADTAVPPEVSQQYVDTMHRAGIPIQTNLIEGADHAMSKPQWRQQLIRTVADWTESQIG